MLTGIFDSHAHYDDPAFDPDREETLARVQAAGVARIVNAGADLETSRLGLELARQHPFLWSAAGVHPQGVHQLPPDYLDQLARLAQDPRVVAIGEIGLDYYYRKDDAPRQQEVFEQQLQLAAQLKLPVIIHDREAHGDTWALLQRYRPAGVVHCFSGSAEMARQVVDLGMYLGFTGVVTFKNARKALEAVRAVPLDRLLVETDCPYMAPEPHRGQRCDSSLLPYTIQALAQAKGVSPQEITRCTYENACRLFGLAAD